MNFTTVVKKAGPIFTEAAKKAAQTELELGLGKIQAHLVRATRANAPVATGALRTRIVERGTGLKRSVAVDLARAVPLEFGWMPASVRQQIVAARNTYKLKGKRKLIRALKARKVAGQKFMYGTFDRLKPVLQSQYVDSLGPAIVKALGG